MPSSIPASLRPPSLLRLLIAAIALLAAACVPGGPGLEDVPTDHTVEEDGVWHKAGASRPEDNCASCHDIEVEAVAGVACIDCHSARFLASGGEDDDEDDDD